MYSLLSLAENHGRNGLPIAESDIDFLNRHVTHPQSRVLLYTGKPLDEYAGYDRIEQVISRVDPGDGRQIVDLAHPSITLPPHDSHYGKHGEYRNGIHYWRWSANRKVCLDGQASELGEKTFKNRILYGSIQRLAYNPFYEEMMDHMDSFLFLE